MIRRIIVIAMAASSMLALLAVTPASASERETAGIVWMPPSGMAGPVDGGVATLNRNAHGASYTFKTTGVQHNHAYTIWQVVFNAPENCATAPTEAIKCGASDLSNPAVGPSLQFGGGNIAGNAGTLTIAGSIKVGSTKGCEPGLPCNSGLTDVDGAEIHLVVRTHGQAVPGYVNDQIDSFNGGCNAGEPNVGQCKNLQAAPFA